MRYHVPFLLLLSALAGPVHADLALVGFSAAGPFSTQEKIWIQGTRLRRDFIDRGRAYTHLFDLAGHRVVLIDHLARQVELHDLKSLQTGAEAGIAEQALKLRLDPTGETRALRHWTCEAHRLAASLPARLGTEETVFHLAGTVWIARGTPEQAAIRKLTDSTRRKDFFLGIPAAVQATPAQARMLSELVRALVARGLPCGGELDARHEGGGPMANLASRIPARLSLSIQDFSAAPIKADVFAVPDGYATRR